MIKNDKYNLLAIFLQSLGLLTLICSILLKSIATINYATDFLIGFLLAISFVLNAVSIYYNVCAKGIFPNRDNFPRKKRFYK